MGVLDYTRNILISKVFKPVARQESYIVYEFFKATCDPVALKEISTDLASKVFPNVNCLISPGMGALAMATSVALKLLDRGQKVTILVVRSPYKIRDGETLVEGEIPDNPIAAFIDDSIISGKTYHEAVGLVKDVAPSLKVIQALLFLDVQSLTGSRRIHASGVPIYSCFSRRQLGLTRDDSSMAVGGVRLPAVKKLLWQCKLEFPHFNHQASKPVQIDNDIIVCDNKHVISRVGPTGVSWTFDNGLHTGKGMVQEPLVIGDRFIASGYSGFTFCIDINTGGVIWKTKCADYIHATPILYKGLLHIVGEIGDVTGQGGNLTVLDLDGNLKYSFKFSDKYAPCTPVVTESGIIVTSNSCEIKKFLNTSNIWSFKMKGRSWGSIVEDDNKIYIADDVGYIYCIDNVSGNLIWETEMSTAFIHSKPLIMSGVMIVSDNTLYTHGVDLATGLRKWLIRTRSQVPWGPVPISDTHILLTGQDGDISIVDSLAGIKVAETRLRLGIEEFIRQPGSVKGNQLSIVTSMGNVRVYEVEDSYVLRNR